MTDKNRYLYMRLYNEFKENIDTKLWKKGMKLPTEHELVEKYDVSRHTVRKALDKLEQDDYINRISGKGTFVNTKSRYKLTSLEGFSEQMRNMGLTPSSKIIDVKLEMPNDLARHNLNLNENEKAYRVERLRLADGTPMSYETVYISKKLCPDIDKYIDSTTSLYRLYEDKYKLNLKYGDIFLEAEICPDNILAHLEIPKYSPVLKMHSVVYADNKIPVYFVESYYIGDKYVFFASMPRM